MSSYPTGSQHPHPHKPTPHQPLPPRPVHFADAVSELLASLRPATEIVARGFTPSTADTLRDFREQADGAPYEEAA